MTIIHIVSDELLKIGINNRKRFFSTVELNVKFGINTIKPANNDDCTSTEIYQIFIDCDVNHVDLSYMQNDKNIEKLQTLIDDYKWK